MRAGTQLKVRVGAAVVVAAAAIGLSAAPAEAVPRPGPIIGQPPIIGSGPAFGSGVGPSNVAGAVQTAGTIEPTLDCIPSAEQPNPVVVLGGFGAVGDIRTTLDKQMAGITGGIHNLGGCPFIFGYGIIGPMQAAAPVPESAGVVYSVLATRGDRVLTPPGPASFIDDPRVENDYFEDLYPKAGLADHATLPMQPEAAQWVIKQLLSE